VAPLKGNIARLEATEAYRKGWKLLEATGWRRQVGRRQVGGDRLEATGWRQQTGGGRLGGLTSNTLDARRGRRIMRNPNLQGCNKLEVSNYGGTGRVYTEIERDRGILENLVLGRFGFWLGFGLRVGESLRSELMHRHISGAAMLPKSSALFVATVNIEVLFLNQNKWLCVRVTNKSAMFRVVCYYICFYYVIKNMCYV